jgi:glucose-6-phosphate isomerase
MSITIHDQLAKPFIRAEAFEQLSVTLLGCHSQLIGQTGAGNDFLGWMDLPDRMLEDKGMWSETKRLSELWKEKRITHILVIGIGGSYLGARAIYDALRGQFSQNAAPKLLFCGHHMSAQYLDELIWFLKTVSFGVIVISKSGTTLEPALVFRIIRKLLNEKHGLQEANQRIIAITDAKSGALRNLTNQSGWPSFQIEDTVGGRYSVLSPVGLVPLFLAGIDVRKMLQEASAMRQICINKKTPEENPALHYAALRYLFYLSGRHAEILASFQPELQYFIEWWKQLFGESDGKDKKGIFPSGAVFSTDLHSMGQYIQDGMRILFETFLIIEQKPGSIVVPASSGNEDGLDYLNGRNISEINHLAEKATMLAHFEGNAPVIGISVGQLDEASFGSLIYFFEFACAIGGYLLMVNPFDQPGVEAYKRNMFALLGKPGMENQTLEILSKLKNY